MREYYSNVQRKIAECPTVFAQLADIVAKPFAHVLDYQKRSQKPDYEAQNQGKEQERYLIWLP